MRPRFVIPIVVLLALVLWLWLRHSMAIAPSTQATAIGQPTNSVMNNAGITSQGASNTQTSAASPTNVQSSVANNVRVPAGFEQHVESKNSPIEFFGQVIDQDSNALSGVDVSIAVRHWYVPLPGVMDEEGKSIHLEATSDAAGRFEISGATGDAFDLESMTKAGYEVELTRRGFGPSEGSFADPVIFKMWSTNIHEQLIRGENKFKIVPDGRPYFIDLTTDTINESGEGDLKVWIQYTNQVVRGQLYDWSAGIEAIDGGLLEEGVGSAMYEAPTDGYLPAFQLRGQIKGGQYGRTGERKFYLSLKGGQEYGQMSIDLIAPYNDQIPPGLVRLSYAINPSGSRVLR